MWPFNEIKDLIDDAASSISLMIEEFPSFCDDMRELQNDFQETMTDGFKEIVIKGNDNYKTSSELQQEARTMIDQAKQRLAKAQSRTKESSEKLYKFNALLERKRIVVLKHYSSDDHILKSVAQSNFDSSLPTPQLRWNQDDEYLLPGIRLLPEPLARRERVKASKEYLHDAKDYAVFVDAEIVRLHEAQILIQMIERAIKEELNLLDALKAIASRVNAQDRTSVYSKVSTVLQENLLSENTERSTEYNHALLTLKDICKRYETISSTTL